MSAAQVVTQDDQRAGTSQPELIRVAAWAGFPWLLHGFSTRQFGLSRVYLKAPGGYGHSREPGELNLGFTAEDDPVAVAANRQAVLRAVSADVQPALPMVLVRQVHGAVIRQASAATLTEAMADGRALIDGDGLVTDEPGLLIAVQAADCVPVLIADTRRRAVAALHAGWRGTLAGIVGAGVAKMLEQGSRPENLVAAVGPSIGPCCFSVGDEVKRQFLKRFQDANRLFEERDGGTWLDLWEANRCQLVQAGVSADQVTVLAACSACATQAGRRQFFSHRADHGRSGRMMGVIGIRSQA